MSIESDVITSLKQRAENLEIRQFEYLPENGVINLINEEGDMIYKFHIRFSLQLKSFHHASGFISNHQATDIINKNLALPKFFDYTFVKKKPRT